MEHGSGPREDEATRVVTRCLRAMSAGDEEAARQMWRLMYDDLHGLASTMLRGERADPTLQTTALVHESFLRLVGQTRVAWKDRVHFRCVAAQAMHRVLVDLARRERRIKRGGRARRVDLDEPIAADGWTLDEILDLHEALSTLSARNERAGRVVELRFFGGLSIDEVAEALEVSPRTVNGDWQYARAWLHRELSASRR